MEKELRDLLQSIWYDDDFVRGVMNLLKTDKDKKEMIDAIHLGYATEPSDISLYALAIYDDVPFEETDTEQ